LLISSRTKGAPVIVLDVPADFHQVPLEADVQRRTAAQLQVLEDLGLRDQGRREAVSLYLEALAGRLSTGNVVTTAYCAVQLDGHASTATLSVAVLDTHSLDRGLVVLSSAESMRREGRHQSVRVRELGGQQVVTAVAERASVPGDTVSGEVGTTLRELSILVPVPGHEQAVMVALSTPCLEDWEAYERLTHDICRTLHVQSTHPDVIH
jgi:hypothetical protein